MTANTTRKRKNSKPTALKQQTVSGTSPRAVKPQIPQVSIESRKSRYKTFDLRMAGLCLLLAMSTVAIYLPVSRFGFVNYDDGDYVFVNPHVKSGLTWQNVRWSLTGFASGNWHPITWLSHQTDCQLFGLQGGKHHLTSLLLHVCNVVLLFLLLCKGTGARAPSFFVAGLFALHPFNVESVAWVAERKNLLCTFFFLLGLGAYGWYCQRPGWRRYSALAAFFVLGLASKPMVITFPFVLLLTDYWPLRRIVEWTTPSPQFVIARAPIWDLVFEKLPLLGLSAASAVVTVVAQRSAHAVQPLSSFPLSGRIGTIIWAYGQYLWKAFVPQKFAPFYPGKPLSLAEVAVAAVALLAIGYVVFKTGKTKPYVPVGFLWFLGTLVPVIGLVQVGVQSMADRYTYIPLLGIFVAVVWSLFEISENRGWNHRALAAIGVIILGALGLSTLRQVGYWKDSTVLWTHALQITESNYVAEENIAVALANDGHDEAALPHFENVLAIRPDDSTALLNVGMALQKNGQYRGAIELFNRLIMTATDPAEQPRVVAAYRGLGITYTALSDRVKARENFVQAVRLGGEETTDLVNLSIFEADENANKLSKELAVHPSAEGYLQLGELLKLTRRLPDARSAYQKALHLDPHLAAAKQALRELHLTAD